jgi:hypothetical protein
MSVQVTATIVFNPEKCVPPLSASTSIRFDGIELVPGENELDPESYEQLKKHPDYSRFVEIGAIEAKNPIVTITSELPEVPPAAAGAVITAAATAAAETAAAEAAAQTAAANAEAAAQTAQTAADAAAKTAAAAVETTAEAAAAALAAVENEEEDELKIGENSIDLPAETPVTIKHKRQPK